MYILTFRSQLKTKLLIYVLSEFQHSLFYKQLFYKCNINEPRALQHSQTVPVLQVL